MSDKILSFLPIRYSAGVDELFPVATKVPIGRPAIGGKALIYYGQAGVNSAEDFLAFGLPMLLLAALISLTAGFLIRKYWDLA